MTAPIAITGSLVDAKNIAVHKSVRLSIDVPAEQGADIIKAFGWPTMADPVPVAIALLNPEIVNPPARRGTSAGGDRNGDKEQPQALSADAGHKERRRFDELPASQQAAMLCNEPRFRRFLGETRGQANNQDAAAALVREICQVPSRALLDSDSRAGAHWQAIHSEYRTWLSL